MCPFDSVFCFMTLVVISVRGEQENHDFDFGNMKPSLISVYKKTGDVYISGINFLSHFTSDLHMKHLIPLGPYPTGYNCSFKINVFNSTSNVISNAIKVMEVDEKAMKLLLCGSVCDGLCSVHKLDNISDWQWMPTDNQSSVGSSSPVLAMFLDGGESRNLIVAISQPNPSKPGMISFIKVTNATGRDEMKQILHSLEIHLPDDHNQIKIRFIKVFKTENYIYFLTVKSNTYLSYETALFRICLNSVYPILEIPLFCEKDEHKYNIATSAAIGHYYLAKNTSILVVTYGKSLNDTTDMIGDQRETAVCSFKMEDINTGFEFAWKNCEHSAIFSKWLMGHEGKCTKNNKMDQCKSNINAKVTALQATESGLDHKVKTVVQINNILSTIVRNVNDTMYVTFTSSAGNILKYIVKKGNWKLHEEDKTSFVRAEIQNDTAVDSNNKHVYFLNRQKVTKYNLDFCSSYNSCSICVSSDIRCVWNITRCVEFTVELQEYNNTCPPSIHEIFPSQGLLSGGMKITISGKNLGQLYRNNRINVEICGQPCIVDRANKSSILCVTGAVTESQKCHVEVQVYDEHSNIFKINGKVTSRETYHYLKVTADEIIPNLGPLSGGTIITITGRNFDELKDFMVMIGQSECKVQKKIINDSVIMCTTGSLQEGDIDNVNGSNGQPVFCQNLTIISLANNAIINTDQRFCYWEDPTITGVYPHRSIESGGTKVTVIGTNFNVIAKPQMVVTVNNSSHVEDCNDEHNDTSLICLTPKVNDVTLDNDGKPAEAEINFLMDDVDEVKNFSKLHPTLGRILISPDPELKHYEKIKNQKSISEMVYIKGSGLKFLKEEIEISIGELNCEVTEVNNTHVSCRPILQTENTTQKIFPVKVKVGNLKITIGKIEILSENHLFDMDKTKPPLEIYLGVGIAIGVIVILVIVFFIARIYCAVRSRQSQYDHPLHEMSESEYVSISGVQCVKHGMDGGILQAMDRFNVLIDIKKLEIGNSIGSGNFGCVYEGYLRTEDDENPMKVAIKTLQDEFEEFNLKDFAKEALIMKDFKHPNVLTLLGISLKKDISPLVVLPFMHNGDLHSYIVNEDKDITIKDVISFAIDISKGMEYISSLKIVHRDLAARNCMLGADLRVVVADFGLTRSLYEKNYYHSENKKTKLPIRWMALESLEKGTYTSKSDVWSLGVVIWEIFTRGVTPYPGVEGWDVSRYLRSGRRLLRPWFCDDKLYELMLKCWEINVDDRPDFTDVHTQLCNIANSYEDDTSSNYATVVDALPEHQALMTKLTAQTKLSIPECYNYEAYIPAETEIMQYYVLEN